MGAQLVLLYQMAQLRLVNDNTSTGITWNTLTGLSEPGNQGMKDILTCLLRWIFAITMDDCTEDIMGMLRYSGMRQRSISCCYVMAS